MNKGKSNITNLIIAIIIIINAFIILQGIGNIRLYKLIEWLFAEKITTMAEVIDTYSDDKLPEIPDDNLIIDTVTYKGVLKDNYYNKEFIVNQTKTATVGDVKYIYIYKKGNEWVESPFINADYAYTIIALLILLIIADFIIICNAFPTKTKNKKSRGYELEQYSRI